MARLPRWTAEVRVVVSFTASDEDSASSKVERIEKAMRAALVGHRAPTPKDYGVPAGGAVVVAVEANWEDGAILPLED